MRRPFNPVPGIAARQLKAEELIAKIRDLQSNIRCLVADLEAVGRRTTLGMEAAEQWERGQVSIEKLNRALTWFAEECAAASGPLRPPVELSILCGGRTDDDEGMQ